MKKARDTSSKLIATSSRGLGETKSHSPERSFVGGNEKGSGESFLSNSKKLCP